MHWPSRIGLFKTEVIRRREPWVWWLNNHRLLEPFGYVAPVDYEESYHCAREAQVAESVLN